jgi:hypothetical protein
MPLGDDREGFRIRIIYDGFQYITGPLQDLIGYQAPGKDQSRNQDHPSVNKYIDLAVGNAGFQY